jgi:hypothetical protein
MRRIAPLLVLAYLALAGCRSDGKDAGPPIPASSDPEGKDIAVGSIIVGTEPSGGIRIYKVKEVKYILHGHAWYLLPPPMGDELVMIAFNEKGNDFKHAADLWRQRNLTVAVANVRVQRQMFIKDRDYRVIAQEPVTDTDNALQADQKLPPR